MAASGAALLAINGGSSSVKCALFTGDREPTAIARQTVDGTGASSLPRLLEWTDAQIDGRRLAAVVHRIVHGGPRHREPQPITAPLVAELTELVPFAPNHLPDEIALIDGFERHRPGTPQVACFDTAFHHTLPEVARRLPIPARFEARGVRRYGFHGLSYSFLIEELGRVAGPRVANGRVVLAHLGHGSSLAALRDGQSVDTTMAFTPIGGVVMSTRSGDLDPGVVTYLARTERASADEVEALLSQQSGLLGISGVTSDMKTLLEREPHDAACRLAIASYVYAVRKAIGALAAALGGLDVLVFSGGIGEHAAAIRARVCDGLAFLGIDVDRERNTANERLISSPSGRAAVYVIATDEELMMARAASRLLASK